MAAGQGFKTFTSGEVLTAADVNGYLMQGVGVFTDAANRDAEITSPQEGQFAYLKDTNVTTYYTGSAWANLDTTGMTNPMTTTGDTIYSSSGSTPARLGIGSTGQVLTVSGGIPSWATPAGGGGMTLISETVASAVTSISLSSIPQTYKQLMLVWSGIYHSTTGSEYALRFNNDVNNIYAEGYITGNGGSFGNGNSNGNFVGASNNFRTFGNNSTSTEPRYAGKGMLIIDNYSSTTKLKTYEFKGFYRDTTTAIAGTHTGCFNSTSAITSLDIVRISGSETLSNATNTSIRLYGIN
jgi:hypothetical protein